MAWHDDPEIRRRHAAATVRGGLLRTAIIWMPLFLAAAGAGLFFLADQLLGGDRGSWFLVVVLAILAGLFGFQGMQATLDLFTEPREKTAEVTRRWSRSDSFVLKSHYLRLESGEILRGNIVLLDGIKAGDRVRVLYYPHSAVIVDLEKLVEPPSKATEAQGS
jgi:hypothetical protein